MSTLSELRERLRRQPQNRALRVDTVLELLSAIQQEYPQSRKHAEGAAPMGPGRASFPSPCCEGKALLMKATVGVLKQTGAYTRYRTCTGCGTRYRTVESVDCEVEG